MIVIDKNHVHGMWGNIYDFEKLEYVVEMIQNAEDYVEFECSYGIGNMADIRDVAEHQNAVLQDRFESDFEGHERPYTTGDKEIDVYLGTEDLGDYPIDRYSELRSSVSDPKFIQFFNAHKYDIVNGKNTEDSLTNLFNQLGPEEEDNDVFNAFIELENRLAQVNANNQGDLNQFNVQLRDGHHRVMGAIKAGEDYVCLNLDKDSIAKFSKYIKRV